MSLISLTPECITESRSRFPLDRFCTIFINLRIRKQSHTSTTTQELGSSPLVFATIGARRYPPLIAKVLPPGNSKLIWRISEMARNYTIYISRRLGRGEMFHVSLSHISYTSTNVIAPISKREILLIGGYCISPYPYQMSYRMSYEFYKFAVSISNFSPELSTPNGTFLHSGRCMLELSK